MTKTTLICVMQTVIAVAFFLNINIKQDIANLAARIIIGFMLQDCIKTFPMKHRCNIFCDKHAFAQVWVK